MKNEPSKLVRSKLQLAGIERDLPRGAPPVTVDVAPGEPARAKSRATTHWNSRTIIPN